MARYTVVGASTADMCILANSTISRAARRAGSIAAIREIVGITSFPFVTCLAIISISFGITINIVDGHLVATTAFVNNHIPHKDGI